MFYFLNRNLAGTVVAAALLVAVSACSGGTSVPVAPGQNAPALRAPGASAGLSALGALPSAQSCPGKFNAGCYTFSLSKGLSIGWCYGPSSNRCSGTKNYTWSGNVCKANSKKCGTIPQMKAKWSGPYKCTKKICGNTKGYYELDTITKGSKKPQKTQQYVYKQKIQICAGGSCVVYYIGINVGS